MLTFKEPSFSALFHLGLNTAVIIDEKSAAGEATNPVGTGPYKLANWTKGSSVTLDAWDGYRDAAKIAIKHATFKFIADPAAEVGGGAVGRHRRVSAHRRHLARASSRRMRGFR